LDATHFVNNSKVDFYLNWSDAFNRLGLPNALDRPNPLLSPGRPIIA